MQADVATVGSSRVETRGRGKPPVELADIQTFLVLTEELHFTRAASRLYVSSARVSQRISGLERQVGGRLFDRTSRNVQLTALGSSVRDRLRPLYEELMAAIDEARSSSCATAAPLRIGFTATATGERLHRLVRSVEAHCPDHNVVLREVDVERRFDALADDTVDVLVDWLPDEEADRRRWPVLDRAQRVLAVAVDHPLASRASVSVDILADYPVLIWGSESAFAAQGPIRLCRAEVRSVAGVVSVLASGTAVLPTVASFARFIDPDEVVLVPIHGVAPAVLALLWRVEPRVLGAGWHALVAQLVDLRPSVTAAR